MGELQDITRTVQLAVAPVFLLTAMATTLSVLATRLGRIVDRARRVELDLKLLEPHLREGRLRELELLETRAQLIGWALTSGVVAALLVCFMIGTAFVGFLVAVNLAVMVAVLFILSVAVFMLALVFFLREVFLAIAMLRFGLPTEAKKT